MPYTLKNQSGFPLDVPTIAGPVILPAYGEVIAELDALNAEVMRQSPYVELVEGDQVDPLDHDGDGRKGGSAAPAGDADELKRLRAEYTDLAGKKPFAGWKADRLQSEIDKLLVA